MVTRSVPYTVIVVAVLALLMGLSTLVKGAPPQFTVIDLGPLPSSTSSGTDVNDSGSVVGFSFTPGGAQVEEHGTLWTGTSTIDLGQISNRAGRFLYSLNNSGQISGTVEVTGGFAAARWTGPNYTTPQILPPLPAATVSVGDRINTSGQIAGTSGEQPVRWAGTAVEALDPLPGGRTRGDAYGINNSGQVSGWTLFNGRTTAVRWTGTAPEALDSLPGDTASSGYAINSSGQVAGVNSIGGFNRTVRWTGTNVEDLGLLPGATDSLGSDINDDGWVVGESTVNGVPRAFLHDGTTLYDLNDLIVGPNPFLLLQIARGINNAGQITGTGATTNGPSHAFLLTPISDSDSDGIPDNEDICPDTVIPEAVPTVRLGVNRFALTNNDTTFDTRAPTGKRPPRVFTTADTAGCSCEQIITEQGLGQDHTSSGCSLSAMEEWIAIVTP